MADATSHIPSIENAERPAPRVVFPPSTGWWTPERVEYLRNLFQMFFYLLAFPYLMFRFFGDPIGTFKVVGKAQVASA